MAGQRDDLNAEVRTIAEAMNEVAKRINAKFVVDPKRATDFALAVDNRRKRKEQREAAQRDRQNEVYA